MSQASQDFHEIEAVLRRGWIRPIATPTEFALAADAIATLRRERDYYRAIVAGEPCRQESAKNETQARLSLTHETQITESEGGELE